MSENEHKFSDIERVMDVVKAHPDGHLIYKAPGLDPKGAAGAAKPQLHLLPMAGMVAQAAAHQFGKEKYGERNWIQAKVSTNTYISAIFRHAGAFKEGEDLDPESRISHLGHIMASCAIVLDAAKAGTLVDDRVTIKPNTQHDA